MSASRCVHPDMLHILCITAAVFVDEDVEDDNNDKDGSDDEGSDNDGDV